MYAAYATEANLRVESEAISGIITLYSKGYVT